MPAGSVAEAAGLRTGPNRGAGRGQARGCRPSGRPRPGPGRGSIGGIRPQGRPRPVSWPARRARTHAVKATTGARRRGDRDAVPHGHGERRRGSRRRSAEENGASRAIKEGRRHPIRVTGVRRTSATGGGRRRQQGRLRFRGRGEGRKRPGGSPAYQERVRGLGGEGDGR